MTDIEAKIDAMLDAAAGLAIAGEPFLAPLVPADETLESITAIAALYDPASFAAPADEPPAVNIHLDREARDALGDLVTLGQPPVHELAAHLLRDRSAHVRLGLRGALKALEARARMLEAAVLTFRAATGLREMTIAATLCFAPDRRPMPMRFELLSLDRLPLARPAGTRRRTRADLGALAAALTPHAGDGPQEIFRFSRAGTCPRGAPALDRHQLVIARDEAEARAKLDATIAIHQAAGSKILSSTGLHRFLC